ncbi:hypothetical protein PG997_000001 (mitochondrion) [Apiospora hydei]
MKDIKAD